MQKCETKRGKILLSNAGSHPNAGVTHKENTKKHILTSKQDAQHSFASQNIQHPLLDYHS